MRAQIRGLGQALRNTNDGINFIQTAEGALEETHAILQRLKELATQSATGTYTDDDRSFMQQEVEALKSEITRIAEATDFNGIRMLNGSLRSMFGGGTSQINADGLQFIQIGSHGVTTHNPSSGGVPEAVWQSHPLMDNRDIRAILTHIESVAVPTATNALLTTFPAFGAFSNSDIRMGVEIQNLGTANMAIQMGNWGDSISVTLLIDSTYLNGAINTAGNAFVDSAARDRFDSIIAHEMMHAFMAVGMNNGMMGSNAYPSWFVEGTAQAAGAGGDWARSMGINSASTDAQMRAILNSSQWSLPGNSTSSHYGTGYLATMYLADMVSRSPTSTASAGNRQQGLNEIFGMLMLGSSLDDIIATHTKYSGLVDFQNGFGNDTEAYDFIRNVIFNPSTGIGATGQGSLLATNLGATNSLSNANATPRRTFLNIDRTASSQVWNRYAPGNVRGAGGGSFTTGVPVSDAIRTHITGLGIQPATEGLGAGIANLLDGLVIQVGDRASTHTRTSIIIDDMTTTGLYINGLDISRQTDAIAALGALGADGAGEVESIGSVAQRGTIDHAVFLVSKQRADLGATQNRLEHTANSLTTTQENITASESQIRDTDMALEMIKYTKFNILQQAAQAMLAQANQAPQAILQLLR
jgi:flagellin